MMDLGLFHPQNSYHLTFKMNITKKIGFCCKWIDYPEQVNGIRPKDDCKKFNTGTTTVAWLNRQSKNTAEEKLLSLAKQNLESTFNLVKRVSELPEELKMVRLSSDILPVFTEPTWKYFWKSSTVSSFLETEFAKIGKFARENNVRLSMHPGQYTVLASETPEIVEKSIEEFEYHATMAAWMGFGQRFQDFKINIHISGRQGPEGIRKAYIRLSPEARNCITVENEEMSFGLDDCLSLSDVVPTVLDIHHHFIREGEYIQRNDPRIQRVIDSWRGVRPTFHYSVSREDILANYPTDQLLNLKTLLESGHKKQQLRAHSDFMWNDAINEWALTHLEWGDCMVEAKAKNLASQKLYNFWKNSNNSVT